MKTTLSYALLAACFAMPAFAGNDTTPAEVQNAEMHNQQTMNSGATPDAPGDHMMHHDHIMNHEMKGDMMFSKMDANGDGKISKDEWMSFAKNKFKMADTNNDGYVTKDEMEAMHKKEWEKMHADMPMHAPAPMNETAPMRDAGPMHGTNQPN